MGRLGSGLSFTGRDTMGGVQRGKCHRVRTLAAVSGVDTGSPGQELVGLTVITAPSLEDQNPDPSHRPPGLNPGIPTPPEFTNLFLFSRYPKQWLT